MFPRSIRQFSTSSPSAGKNALKFFKAEEKRNANIAKQLSIKKGGQVDPVAGKSDSPFINRLQAEVVSNTSLSHGYEKQDVEKLLYGAQKALIMKSPGFNEEQILSQEEKKREAVNRILNIKNASKGLQRKLSTALAMKEFQRFDGDTGSSEVQAAAMTTRIQYLLDHMKRNKNDYANIRKLRTLVQQRQSILRYLKRDNPKRYYWAIEKLGLTDEAVTIEFNMDRKYMQEFKVFGDRTIISESKKVREEQRKEIRKEKK